MKYHIPVLLNEVIEELKIKPGGRYIDATVGDGGHTGEILKRGGTVLGIDRDGEAIERTRNRFKKEIKEERLVLMRSNFDRIGEIGEIREIGGIPTDDGKGSGGGGGGGGSEGLFDGILFDLGMSSWQIEESGRGFSFLRDEPLDMRMEPGLGVTAADLVNGLGKKELVSLFLRLGQVERAAATADEIVRRRQEVAIKTTKELAEIVEKVSSRKGRLHPATKVFMALRMAVNDELGSLERVLPQAAEMLVPGGRLAVISFHEGEDRIVKRFFRSMSFASVSRRADPRYHFLDTLGRGGDSGTFFSGDARLRDGSPDAGRLKPRSLRVRPIPGLVSNLSLDVTGSLFPGKKAPSSPSGLFANFDGAKLLEINKKPITPGPNEVRGNPRARSAKLRVVERIITN